MKHLIAFTGRMHCGKTTAALALVKNLDYFRLSFARPIRDMLLALGCTEEELTVKKDEFNPLLGHDTRYALQTLGTDWGRNLMGEDIWVRVMEHRIQQFSDLPIVIDDCRFDNEAKMIRALGGVVVEIVRPTLEPRPAVPAHASEAGVSSDLVDELLLNSGSEGDLVDAALKIAQS